jgi:hypothetical protein
MVAGANCHHATRRAPNLPLLGALTVRGLGLNSPQGVNTGGLFVRRGDRELKRDVYASVTHGNHGETQGIRQFYTGSGLWRVKSYIQFFDLYC